MCKIQIDTFRYQIFTVIDHALALSITGLFKYCIVLERSLHFVFAVDVIRELIIERHYWIVKRKSNSNQSIDTSTRITMTTSRRRLVLAAVCSGGDNKWYICLVLCWAPHRGPRPGPGPGRGWGSCTKYTLLVWGNMKQWSALVLFWCHYYPMKQYQLSNVHYPARISNEKTVPHFHFTRL